MDLDNRLSSGPLRLRNLLGEGPLLAPTTVCHPHVVPVSCLVKMNSIQTQISGLLMDLLVRTLVLYPLTTNPCSQEAPILLNICALLTSSHLANSSLLSDRHQNHKWALGCLARVHLHVPSRLNFLNKMALDLFTHLCLNFLKVTNTIRWALPAPSRLPEAFKHRRLDLCFHLPKLVLSRWQRFQSLNQVLQTLPSRNLNN